MKSVLFIMRYYIGGRHDSLQSKFKGQMKAVESLGYNVWFTGIAENAVYLCNADNRIKIGELNQRDNSFFSKIKFYATYYRSLINALEKNGIDFNIAYIRNLFFTNNSIKLLKTLKKNNVKIVMEIPSYPIKDEIKRYDSILLKSILYASYNLMKLHSKYVDLYAVIGECFGNVFFGRKAIRIINGVDINILPFRLPEPKDAENDEMHLLAVASMSYWHGYDRLIKGLFDYYRENKKEKIYIHLVGGGGDGSLDKWKKLAEDLKLNDHVIFEGYLTGDMLDRMFDISNVAVSSLAGYRKNLFSSAELKSREYMARGIPFVYATDDKILELVPEYCLRVENNSSNIDFNQVIDFIKRTRKDPSITDKMRAYAETSMSWVTQLRKVFVNIDETL